MIMKNQEKGLIQLVRKSRTCLVFLICTEMCGNGARINGMMIIMGHQQMEVRGFSRHLRRFACCVVVPGAIIRGTVVPRIETGIELIFVATITDFVFPGLLDCNPFPLFPLPRMSEASELAKFFRIFYL